MFISSLPRDKLPMVYMQVSFADVLISALVNHIASSTSAILKTIVVLS